MVWGILVMVRYEIGFRSARSEMRIDHYMDVNRRLIDGKCFVGI